MRSIFAVLILALLVTACGSSAEPVTTDTILAAWKAAGLEAENTHTMTKDDYGAAPYVCTGVRFFLPSLGKDKGGRLYVCDNKADRDALASFYQELGKKSAMLFSWVFVKGDFVVQINGDLDEATARQYESILNATVP